LGVWGGFCGFFVFFGVFVCCFFFCFWFFVVCWVCFCVGLGVVFVFVLVFGFDFFCVWRWEDGLGYQITLKKKKIGEEKKKTKETGCGNFLTTLLKKGWRDGIRVVTLKHPKGPEKIERTKKTLPQAGEGGAEEGIPLVVWEPSTKKKKKAGKKKKEKTKKVEDG